MVLFISFLVAALLWGSTSCLVSKLSGKDLRVGYLENPPHAFMEHGTNNETIVRGIAIKLLEWVAKRGNFTYNLIPIDYTDRFNGLPKEFKDKSLDWGLGNWGLLYGRHRLADILFPYDYNEHTFIIPFPSSEANIWSFVLPYHPTVWYSCFGAMVLLIILLKWFAIAKTFVYHFTFRDSFLTYTGTVQYVLGVATNQGATCFSKARSARLLAAVWCLAALVLVNAYSGSLITYMTIPKVNPLLNSINELANRSEPRILTRGDSYIRVLFETNPLYQQYYENVVRYPSKFCGLLYEQNINKCMLMVKNGGHVLAIADMEANILLDREFTRTGTCEFSVSEERYGFTYLGAVLPRNSPHDLRDSVDLFTLEAISYGLMNEWSRQFQPRQTYCLKYRTTMRQTIRRLSLKDFASAFVIFGIGNALSIAAFVYEQFGRKCSHQSRNEKNVN